MESTGCRLCLEMTTDANFVILEDSHKNMLQVLIPVINWSNVINGQPKMCQKCFKNLQITCLFKSSCLDNNKKVEIENKESSNTFGKTLGIRQTCCLCHQGIVFEDLTDSVRMNLKEMVHRCFPQLRLYSLDNLDTCEKCLSSLRDLDSFIISCLATEEYIKNYCSTMSINREDFNLDEYIERKYFPTISTDAAVTTGETAFSSVSEGMETTAPETNPVSENAPESNGTELQQKADEQPDSAEPEKQAIEPIKLTDDNSSDQRNEPKKKKHPQSPGTFYCDRCDYNTKNKHALVSHMVRHRDPAKTKMHRCVECGHETKRIADLRWHMIVHKNPEEVKMYYCANCPYQSKRKGDLKEHMMIHNSHTFKCTFCSFETKTKKYLDTVHMLLHKDTSEMKIYKCGSCSYETITKNRLYSHIRIHKDPSEIQKFRCNWCDFETRYKQGIRTHQDIHRCRSELQKYRCNFCDYEGTRKAHLKDHMSKHVVSTVTYDCGECAYKAKHKKYLRKHMQVHKDLSEVTLHKCHLCVYQSKRKGNLKSHLYSHVRSLQASNKQEEIKELMSKIRNMSKT